MGTWGKSIGATLTAGTLALGLVGVFAADSKRTDFAVAAKGENVRVFIGSAAEQDLSSVIG
ncbi:hypothetical protein [Kocuria kalidii]|uniref:hypothetical protein n=1 Tax=Kocuria kalidii TaxID=3376283 RepID=UPI0037A0F53C